MGSIGFILFLIALGIIGVVFAYACNVIASSGHNVKKTRKYGFIILGLVAIAAWFDNHFGTAGTIMFAIIVIGGILAYKKRDKIFAYASSRSR